MLVSLFQSWETTTKSHVQTCIPSLVSICLSWQKYWTELNFYLVRVYICEVVLRPSNGGGVMASPVMTDGGLVCHCVSSSMAKGECPLKCDESKCRKPAEAGLLWGPCLEKSMNNSYWKFRHRHTVRISYSGVIIFKFLSGLFVFIQNCNLVWWHIFILAAMLDASGKCEWFFKLVSFYWCQF